MLKIISIMSQGLERLKGFNTGYTTDNSDHMLVEVEGKVYLVKAKELGEGTVDDFMDNLYN